MGRPVAVNWQDNGQHGLYVWCEVDPEWANLKEDSDQVEWHWLRFVATGMEFEGKYVGTVFETNRKSTRLNSSHTDISRMPSSA